MNDLYKKTALTALIGLLSLLHIIAQDTLIYRYMNPLMLSYIYPVEKPKPADSLNWYYEDWITSLYYINDSVFIIEDLFGSIGNNKNLPYRYHFKIDSAGQWFMKYEADWKLFFNGIDDVIVGSWMMRGDMDMGFLWKKTTMTDGSDTVYILQEMSFDYEFADALSTFYFTASSGIIALYSSLIWIREDKMYLKSSLDSYRRLPRRD